jgi:hypothetical protein
MNRLKKVILVPAFCAVLLSACGGVGSSSCGRDFNYVGPIGYSASLVRYDKPIETLGVQTSKPLTPNESPSWDSFSLELSAQFQGYSGITLPRVQFSLFPQALACSPAPITVTKISITSANAFSDKYPAGSELNDVFGFIDPYSGERVSRVSNGLALSTAMYPLLKLKLLEAPQYARQNFSVQISLRNGNTYSLNPGDVYFALP